MQASALPGRKDVLSLPGLPSLPTPAVMGTACERCHRYKEKCIFADKARTCARCLKVKSECVPRVKKRIGRPPVVKMAHATILDVGSLPDAGCPVSRRHRPGRPEQDQRRRDHALIIPSSTPPTHSPTPLVQNPLTVEHTQLSHNIKHAIATAHGFHGFHRSFMLGATFTSSYQSSTLIVFDLAPHLFSHAYCALVSALFGQHDQTAPTRDRGLALASSCLGQLGSLTRRVGGVGDAAVVVMLAQLMLVFDSLAPPPPSTRTMAKGALLAARPWYPCLLREASLDPITLAPVFVDTVDSLLRREVPVVRVPQRSSPTVDRLLGLSVPLFALLYDLCVVSHACRDTDSSDHDPYVEIEAAILDWAPSWPRDFFSTYSPLETTKMLAQARAFRLAALLVIHRLRHPLGVEDEAAHLLADEVLLLLARLAGLEGDCATGLGLDFPLLVAMVERPGPGREVDAAFAPLRYRQRDGSAQVVDVFEAVEAARRGGYHGLWLDLVDGALPGVFIP